MEKKYVKCRECNKIRTSSYENHQICHICYIAKRRIIPSGNKVIDDFIIYTQTNNEQDNGKMIFVPYENFNNIEHIGEGGFSKIYKATWIDCKISDEGTLDYTLLNKSKTVALKKLNDSKDITSKELNELKMFYHYSLNGDNLIYDSHSSHVNVYYGITQDRITQDLIFIMPYYNSDLTHYIIKDFFNIHWSFKLTILKNIIDGLADIHVKRPIADEILKEITEIYHYGHKPIIIKSSDIGPVTTNNPKAIYKSRYLSDMIKSAASTISLRIQSVTSELVKRKFNDNQLDNSIDNRFDNGKNIKRIKIIKDESIDYITTELEFDIDTKSDQSNDEYITNEIDFDI
ncbi:kinase-like domain-containing protein [Rhizophagus irregularis DAOM 181602=DAOM 197198]|nr:kinase-like domain-containing protein [Rhizophagus irregularis DAOM 181602=DAOM 197198]